MFAGIGLGASYEGRPGICKHANTKSGVPVKYLGAWDVRSGTQSKT